MGELQTRSVFDAQERELVRGALRRYMSEHKLGTPGLMVKLRDADVPRHREIPLSTLQRFLRGRHHTHDHHVALCHAFVRELPYFGEGRDLVLFGAALASFLPLRWPETDGSGTDSPDRFCGRYSASTDAPQDTAVRIHERGFELDYGTLTFSREENSPYLRVVESVSVDLHHSQPGNTDAAYLYEGVFAAFGPLLRLFLRSKLTRQPRFYDLQEIAPGILRGSAREPLFLAELGDTRQIIEMRCLLYPEGAAGE